MADALVGAAAQILLEKVLSVATDNISLVFGFKKDVETLRESIAMIQAVLADAEKKQHQQEAIKLWLKKLEGVAYEADNVFDELNYEILRRRVETTQNPLQDKVCFFFSSSNTVTFRWRMARKVRDINLKLKAINEEANRLVLQSQLVATGSNTTIHPTTPEVKISRETDSVVDQNVVGRAKDVSMVVEKLLSPSVEAISFFPITGMGGLGKTTLAQLVYNDPQIDNYFGRKIWVCVSNNFNVTRVFKLILESLWRKNVDIVSRDAIVQEIKKELEGKRYLLVLDDLWCENFKIWDDFLRSLRGISTMNGSWSVVTTRLRQVALIVTANPPLVLEQLSNDDCWTILKEKAFPSGEVPEEANTLKEEIIRECQGVPLVASVIGGLIRINAKEKWLSIVRDEIPNMIGKKDDSVMQILRLSFDHLPSASIKKCFAYCSLFGKDFEMEQDMLIQLWMAEGFLQSNHGNEMEMEAIGYSYFDILVKSSLFQEVTDVFGHIFGRMHDLVHDLSELVSESNTINLEQGVRKDNNLVRYLVLGSLQKNIHSMLKERSRSLRTVFIECGIFNDFLSRFKCLRVLDLSRAPKYEELPNSIGQLIHLRYLDLSSSQIEALPESLCKLYNLQTLRISYCDKLMKLPRGMSNLISLRHLRCNIRTERFEMPLRMGKLTSLQTLEFFNIGQEKDRQIEEIGWLTNLRGRLRIRNLELVNGKEGAQLANLSEKSKLIDLAFEWASNRHGDNDDEIVLEGLKPHPNLQELAIRHFMGSRFPSWIVKMGCIDNLVRLWLHDCRRCKEIPPLGQLQFLKDLLLWRLDNIRCIGLAFYGVDRCSRSGQLSKQSFPALQSLYLCNLVNLVDWMGVDTMLATGEAVEVFPKLERLRIERCPQLTTIPDHFPCLERFSIWRCGSNTESLLLSICKKVTTLTCLGFYATEGLISVPDMVFSNNQNLESLHLVNCENLMHVATISLSTCENLKELEISGCPNLKSVFFPCGQQLPSSLRRLQINECNELSSLPDELIQSCTSLQRLEVYSCPNLVSFPVDLQQTPSLSSLDVSDCPRLIAMPKGIGGCINLRQLTIGPFSDSVEFEWSTLSSSSIRKLSLHGWPHSAALPDQLQCLTEITELWLSDFGSIESLPDWLENLISLEELYLRKCEKLMYLPSVEAMRRLTNLHTLSIGGCPLLEKRCTPSSGRDSEWSKISHISKITIDYVERIK